MKHRKLRSVLCDDINGWEGGPRGRAYTHTYSRFTSLYSRNYQREGIYVYLQQIHFIVKQKLPQHCKATIFQ